MNADISAAIKHWLATHPMAPAFQIAELAKEINAEYKLQGKEAIFHNSKNSVHPWAIALDGEAMNLETLEFTDIYDGISTGGPVKTPNAIVEAVEKEEAVNNPPVEEE